MNTPKTTAQSWASAMKAALPRREHFWPIRPGNEPGETLLPGEDEKPAMRRAMAAIDDRFDKSPIHPQMVARILDLLFESTVNYFQMDPQKLWDRRAVMDNLQRVYRRAYPEDRDAPLAPPVKFDRKNGDACRELADWVAGLAYLPDFSLDQVAQIYGVVPATARRWRRHGGRLAYLSMTDEGRFGRWNICLDLLCWELDAEDRCKRLPSAPSARPQDGSAPKGGPSGTQAMTRVQP